MHEFQLSSVVVIMVVSFIAGVFFDRLVLLPMAYLATRVEDAIRSRFGDGDPRSR